MLAFSLVPILFADFPWLTPRIWYLPSAGLAVALAGLIHSVSALRQPAVTAVAGFLLAGFPVIVGIDGVARDANAYIATFQREVSIAQRIAGEMRSGEHLVVLASPWVLVSPEEAPALGEHIVQAFAVDWAATGAMVVLTDVEPGAVTVARDAAAACIDSDGSLLIGGQPTDDSVVFFDFESGTVFRDLASPPLFPCTGA
jgi:hypothetical protein